MSNSAHTTISTVFDFQRSMLEQSQSAFKQSVEIQKRTANAVVDSMDSQHAVQQESAEMFQRALHAYLDAVEQMVPGDQIEFDEVRQVADQQFEQMNEVSEESWAAVKRAVEEGFEALDAMADVYVESVDSSFDAFLDTYEQVEAQAMETADAVQIDVESE